MGRLGAWLLLLVCVGVLTGLAVAEEENDERARRLVDQGAQTKPVTLDEAVRMAMRANLTLLAGAYDPAMAMEAYRAESTIFDPLVSSGFKYGHQETPQVSAFFGLPVTTDDTVHFDAGVTQLLKTGGTVGLLYQADRLDTNSQFITLNPSWTQNAVLQASQPILRGAGDVVMANIRLARNGVTIAQENQRGLVQTILFEVCKAYWNLVFMQADVGARIKSEDVAAGLLRDAQARLDAKLGTPLEVAEAKAGLERRIGDRVLAVGNRGQAQDLLRTLVMPFGRNDTEGVVFVATDAADEDRGMAPEEDQLNRYVAHAVANRPEMRASKANLANRSIDVFAAANAVRPQLDLVGQIGTAGLDGAFGQSFGDMASGEAVSGAIGVQFSMFVGRRAAKANLRLTEWARRQASINVKEVENQVVKDVRNALRSVLVSTAVEQASKEGVVAADENLRGEKHLLANGKSTPFQVLLKEDTLTLARLTLYRASSDRQISEAGFWAAMGMLAETMGIKARAQNLEPVAEAQAVPGTQAVPAD